ncbi:MAG: hypothetical protein KF752_20185 [Pirellulaceae bacterium]|nr:hypothetical protein [Pirellulaceae bacterium]
MRNATTFLVMDVTCCRNDMLETNVDTKFDRSDAFGSNALLQSSTFRLQVIEDNAEVHRNMHMFMKWCIAEAEAGKKLVDDASHNLGSVR